MRNVIFKKSLLVPVGKYLVADLEDIFVIILGEDSYIVEQKPTIENINSLIEGLIPFSFEYKGDECTVFEFMDE